MSACIVTSRPSSGALKIAERADLFVVRNNRLPHLRHTLAFNWGSHDIAHRPGQRVLNPAAAVHRSSDKALALPALHAAGVPVPPHGRSAEQLLSRHPIVLARTTTRGSEGAGIVVIRRGDPITRAPLYTGYIEKTLEYRVHVCDGRAIHIQQKRKRNGRERDRDDLLLRNVSHGWVFTENNLSCDTDGTRQQLEDVSVRAVSALALDYGGVDVIRSRSNGSYVVLEVNSMPGIESTRTTEAWSNAFTSMAERLRGGQ